MSKPQLYIGVMTGTSVDAIDCCLVDFSKQMPKILCQHSSDIPKPLRQQCLKLNQPEKDEIHQMMQADVILGRCIASACNELLHKANLSKEAVQAIGLAGQTIRHQPNSSMPTSLQIGDANIVAEQTGINVVADFRRRDCAAGGQGAPLTPLFHQQLLLAKGYEQGLILNIGGISNITASVDNNLLGFDCGPGNALMDSWCQRYFNSNYDKNAELAIKGKCLDNVLFEMLTDDYFSRPFPKSTGRDVFNQDWLERKILKVEGKSSSLHPHDILRTLLELTVKSIEIAIEQLNLSTMPQMMVCGGGAYNPLLMARLANTLAPMSVVSCEHLGVAPQWVESMAFAWLAHRYFENKPTTASSVTGANHAVISGALYKP